jgi:hypothetical protein
LEELGAGGKRTQHPAAEARVGPGAEGRAVFLPSARKGQTGGAESVTESSRKRRAYELSAMPSE